VERVGLEMSTGMRRTMQTELLVCSQMTSPVMLYVKLKVSLMMGLFGRGHPWH
jgi:hypothetical protein